MIRAAAIAALLASAAALAPGAAAQALRLDITAPPTPKVERASDPKLKMNALVEGAVIRLGDLVEDAGDAADAEVAPAPAPGQRLALDAGQVISFARAKGLAVADTAPGRKVIVSRAGRTVPQDLILSRLADALVAQGVSPEKARQIQLANQRLSIKVPVEAQANVMVENVDFDEATGRFTAIITTPGETAAVEHLEVAGRLVDTTRVPVPRANLAPGQVIRASDMEWIDMPTQRVGSNVILASEQIVGQAPRRALRAGSPVIMSDVERPQMVAKGAMVTMVVTTPNLTLTAIGKALEAGALGDTVRLVNPSSNKTIQGLVTAPNEVRVGFGAQLVSANATLAAPTLQ
jgi:flagella basal body P-ring formation protein FlgA